MLWTIIWILLIIWILGLIFKVAGGLINIVLVIAVIIFIVKLVQGRGRRRG
ncbi:lmo0937 family membrane protein [Metabacillus sp. GX 13764]|uniref:lmo0937 family membrane protein n=1 Tax=Metabacillus kandeliae TaxID=2900151 RepID=UPI001E5A61DD|nr:lmo0937 family membrane protein [Metabacillus kandeliae]MCD7035790.1 lmo0937 family membrane protein [Metabacillus kandeliae]